MATATRVYKTTGPGGPRLIRAASRSQSIRHYAGTTIEAEPASQDDLIKLISEGVAVEDAADPEQLALAVDPA